MYVTINTADSDCNLYMYVAAVVALTSLAYSWSAMHQFELDLEPRVVLHRVIETWVQEHSRLEAWVLARDSYPVEYRPVLNCTAYMPYRTLSYMGIVCTPWPPALAVLPRAMSWT